MSHTIRNERTRHHLDQLAKRRRLAQLTREAKAINLIDVIDVDEMNLDAELE